jgi:hypothetical protein
LEDLYLIEILSKFLDLPFLDQIDLSNLRTFY